MKNWLVALIVVCLLGLFASESNAADFVLRRGPLGFVRAVPVRNVGFVRANFVAPVRIELAPVTFVPSATVIQTNPVFIPGGGAAAFYGGGVSTSTVVFPGSAAFVSGGGCAAFFR